MSSGLNLTVHHLLAVYSGGKLNLNGAGYQPNTNQNGKGVGIGTIKCTLAHLYLFFVVIR